MVFNTRALILLFWHTRHCIYFLCLCFAFFSVEREIGRFMFAVFCIAYGILRHAWTWGLPGYWIAILYQLSAETLASYSSSLQCLL